jgi:hypothetical protein
VSKTDTNERRTGILASGSCHARRVTTRIPDGLSVADERHHPVGDGAWWNESWYFDFATTDGALGGYVRLGLYPNQRKAWYWACLVGVGRPLVSVVDHDVAPPPRASLEVRAEGLWADHTVEVPFDHMTLGCEAFALALDDPAESYGAPRGERVPFGLDLEWDTDGSAYLYPAGATRYEVPCHVHGEVLVGDERLQLDAIGQRDHSWGTRDWWALAWTWTAGWLDDGTRFHGTAVRYGDEAVPYHPGYVQPPDAPLAPVRHTATAEVLGDDGFPASATFEVGDLGLAIEPVAFAPVLLDDGGGRVARFPRALCRFHDPATGRRGVGWTEWNQPQAVTHHAASD